MAKSDDTYYIVLLNNGRIPAVRTHGRRDQTAAYGHSFTYKLTGGSGTATLTVLGAVENTTYDEATDITTAVLRTSSVESAAGEVKKVLILDTEGRLRGFRYVWLKIVLDTSGADDADYELLGSKAWRIN